MKNFDYTSVSSIEQAASVAKQGNAVFMGGGTDLVGVLKDKLLPTAPETVINLKTIPGFDAIEVKPDGLHIGAGATLTDIHKSDLVNGSWASLGEAAYSIATPNLRNTATLGGNICQDIRCWYYRYPNGLGGRIDCARKEGHLCSATMGENRYHSIFGAAKVSETPCTGKCPAKTDISAYMELMRAGDMDGAAKVIMEVNPMPAITSRVCAHFCMEDCNRIQYDQGLNIGSVERYLGDYILENYEKFMTGPKTENGKTVSIVGSGPAGLTAAYYMRQAGYKVEIYERQKEAGGCLTYAIPDYRLPRNIVRKFVEILAELGVTFHLNVNVGHDIQLDEICKNSDSVMLDTGTWKRPLIGLAGEEMTRFGLDFLVDVNNYILERPGANVVVVGGGNVAMDVAITARRLGSPSVKMLCLEQRDSMPANQEEIDRALEEDVEILNGWGPQTILCEDDKVSGMAFRRCTKVLDATGRFNPTYDENDILNVDADIILMAIGQRADLAFLDGTYKVETERGRILASKDNATNIPGIFVGGDVTTGPATVIAAIAAGKNAALSMNRYLKGEALPVEGTTKAREASKETLHAFSPDYKCRTCSVQQPLLPIDQRGMDKEDMGGISKCDASGEANRCFNCGCLAVNPSDMANMLYALNAKVVTNLRTLSSDEFFGKNTRVTDTLLPGELVTEVIVPKPQAGSVAKYDKYRIRKSIDFAILAVATNYTVKDGIVEDASIVLGAVAPVAMKMTAAEDFLKGKTLTEDIAKEAAEIALKDALPLDKNAYKIDMAKVMVRRSLGF